MSSVFHLFLILLATSDLILDIILSLILSNFLYSYQINKKHIQINTSNISQKSVYVFYIHWPINKVPELSVIRVANAIRMDKYLSAIKVRHWVNMLSCYIILILIIPIQQVKTVYFCYFNSLIVLV
jgi:hypothetical protein